MHGLKLVLLYIAKYCGLFSLARLISRRGLRILCYHGFSLRDEHIFRPKLFITPDTFKQRLKTINKLGYSVISLDDAVHALETGDSLIWKVVITIDDGWHSTAEIAAPCLASHGFPWTLYLTTYYAEKQTPIVNVAIHYLVWKSTRLHISLAAFNSEIDSNVYLRTNREKHAFAESMLKKAAKLNTAEARHDFLRNLAIALEVDLSEIEKTRILHIMTLDTARDLYQKGGDIQLHTHRHILVHGNKEQILLEIEDNRRRVSAIGNLNAVHFCYPSGEYAIQDYVHLAECGIKSATTCNPGLNFKSANLLALCRFLDGENISQIEFEAELSGFSHFIRPHRKSLSSSKAMGDKL